MSKELTIQNPVDIIPNIDGKVAELKEKISQLDTSNLTVTSDVSELSRLANGYKKALVSLRTGITKDRRLATKDLEDLLKQCKDLEKLEIGKVELVEAMIDNVLRDIYNVELQKKELLEKKAKEAQERIELETEGEQQELEKKMLADELRYKQHRVEANKVKNVRKYLKFEVVNPSQVERDLCSPDDKKIRFKIDIQRNAFENQGITDLKEIAEKIKIQGVRVYEEISI